MRLSAIFFILALLVLIPFLIWGDFFETAFSWEGSRDWLEQYGRWAWAAGMGLLIADLALPLPNTLVIAGLGYIYGVFIGGLLGALGTVCSGLLAYGLCRGFGRRAALWIEGEAGLAKGEEVFRRAGGWIVALSRWLPMIPEVIACVAGLHRMPFRIYLAALCCGRLPLGFVYAALGQYGQDRPLLATVLSLVVPPILWLIVHPLVQSQLKSVDTTGKE